MSEAQRDQNHVTSALGVSSVDGVTTLPLKVDPVTGRLLTNTASGDGDVVGPASATDNAVVRFDGTTGKLIQNSTVIVTDAGAVTGVTDLSASGTINAATAITVEETGVGTDKITIQAPASIAAGYTLTLPVDDGTNLQFLQTDGNGVLAWATVAAAGITVGTTTVSSGNTTRVLYNNAGVVGEYVISGSGNVAMTTSPVFTTPILGTPTSGNLVNATGYTLAALAGLGTGIATALAVNIGSAGAPVLFNGAGGTPTSLVGTNITGTASGLTAGVASAVAVAGITGLGTGVATFLAAPTSANLLSAVATSNTGTGALVFATSPSLTTPALGTPTALVATNATGTATGLTAGITNALKSATTTVDVSAATAPTTGQVLKATDSTHATWQTLSAGAALDYQQFLASGTWNKPAGLTGDELVFVRCWGAGGGGGSNGGGNTQSAGGGGGSYVEGYFKASVLGTSETVTVGAGGVGGSTGGNNNGSAGDNTTFGTWVTAYGGGGGGFATAGSSAAVGGGGGGLFSKGVNPGTSTGNPGGTSSPGAPLTPVGIAQSIGSFGMYSASGGGVTTGNVAQAGGNSLFGGAGGGAMKGASVASGGTSVYGGNGGNGVNGTGGTGQQPGGGGGGGAPGGPGGDGKVQVWVL